MNPQALKVLFAGTPEFAARHLQALIDSPHPVLAVYTQPDRPAGRGKKLKPSEVKQLALSNKLPVLQPLSLKNTEAQAELAAFNADVMVVVAYGLLLPVPVLQAPRLGCLNVHGSILPRWRGAAPIQRAIEAGDSCSGVTIMQMDEGLDTGDMLIKAECPILDTDTSSDLHDRLAELGPTALLETLARLDNLQPQKQDEQLACYARKIEKAEAEIDWRLPATTLHRRIRAFNPFPVCYTTLADQRLKIHAADIDQASGQPGEVLAADKNQLLVACGEQSLSIQQLQLPGKKPMSAAEFANGHSQLCPVGSRLGAGL